MKPDDFREFNWYYTPPKWYSRYRGGRYHLFHHVNRDTKPDHIREALVYVKENLDSGAVDLKMKTVTERYGSKLYHLIEVFCKDKETAVQFKLSFCDR